MIPIFEWLLSIVAIAFIIGYIQYKWNRKRMERLAEIFPGPPCLPIVGNLFYFLNVTHEDYIYKATDMALNYGRDLPVKFWLGNHLVLVIFNPKDVEAVLCHPKVIDKNLLFQYFKRRSLGAFTLSGEQWRRHRRFANKMFHKSLMEWYVSVFNEQGRELIGYFERKCPTETFDVSRPIMRCTLDTICRTATGVHMNLQKNTDLTFPDDLTISSEIIIERMYKPWFHFDAIFKVTSLGKEMFERIRRIHDFTLSVIMRRRDDVASQTSKPVKSNGFHKGNESTIQDNKLYIDYMFDYAETEKLTDHDIVLAALDIIIGGADTSAIADSYVLVFLGMYKEWQEKIHRELDQLFGPVHKDITLKDIDQLENLEMVIKEILRLYTAPHTVRDVKDDIKLENYTFPAGAVVYILTYLTHRDPKYWSHPNSFHPEHFLPENIASRPKYSYLPFSYGLRSCPGSKYGMISMKILLAQILRKFRVECDLKMENMKHKPSLMLELIGGYPIRIIPRTKFYYN